MIARRTGWESHLNATRRFRRRMWWASHRRVVLAGRWAAVALLLLLLGWLAISLAGCAGCPGPVRDMTVCQADWEQVQAGQVLCTADGRVEIVGRCFDPETSRYWLKVRSRW